MEAKISSFTNIPLGCGESYKWNLMFLSGNLPAKCLNLILRGEYEHSISKPVSGVERSVSMTEHRKVKKMALSFLCCMVKTDGRYE